jgi:hypothetical protein
MRATRAPRAVNPLCFFRILLAHLAAFCMNSDQCRQIWRTIKARLHTFPDDEFRANPDSGGAEGGLPILPPVRRGFGSHFVERLLKDFVAAQRLNSDRRGVVCEISLALFSVLDFLTAYC